MIIKALKFIFFFTIGLIVMQWLFRPEIDWSDVISIAFVAFLLYLLFEFVDKRDERKNKE